jgi:hypothetical protein
MAAVFAGVDASTSPSATPALSLLETDATSTTVSGSTQGSVAQVTAAKSFAWQPKSEDDAKSDDDAVSSILDSIKDMAKLQKSPLSFLQLQAPKTDQRVTVVADFLETVGGSSSMIRLATRLRSGGAHGQMTAGDAAVLLQALSDHLAKSPPLQTAAAKAASESESAEKDCVAAVHGEEESNEKVLAALVHTERLERESAAVAALATAWGGRIAELEADAQDAVAAAEQWEHSAKEQQGLLSGSTALAVAGEGRATRATVVSHEVEGASARLSAAVKAMRTKLAATPADQPAGAVQHKAQDECEANLARVAATELEQSRAERIIQAAAAMLH